MRLATAEIVVNGRRKIVNANDPRVTHAEEKALPKDQEREEEVKPRRGRPRKKAD